MYLFICGSSAHVLDTLQTCECTASALRSSLQSGQRANCIDVRESSTKAIVCSFSAHAVLLLITEDFKQLLVFILKALQFTFKKTLLDAFCWLTLTP